MPLFTNIILWFFSLTLALTGIVFGIIASFNASKANQKITNLIAAYWIANESQKILFEDLKQVNLHSKKILVKLKKELTYNQYALLSSYTRLHPIAKRVHKTLETTEYKSLIKKYLHTKRKLDLLYKKIIGDFEILNSSNFITPQKRHDLIIYHKKLIEAASSIIKEYTKIAWDRE